MIKLSAVWHKFLEWFVGKQLRFRYLKHQFGSQHPSGDKYHTGTTANCTDTNATKQ